mgnify:CR=1 FL=1
MKNTRPYAQLSNLIEYQIAWFSGVLGAAHQQEDLGAFLAFLIVARHLRMTRETVSEYKIVLSTLILGGLWETLIIYLDMVRYEGPSHLSPAPLWILMIWAAFGTTLNGCLAWLQQRYLLSALLGAGLAPLAWYAGESLGALKIQGGWVGYAVLAGGWALLMPLLAFLARYFRLHTQELPVR